MGARGKARQGGNGEKGDVKRKYYGPGKHCGEKRQATGGGKKRGRNRH